MRLPLLIALFLVAAPAVARATEAPDARSAYVERRGLMEADRRCTLFTPGMRTALDAGMRQARGSLLRAGWSSVQVRELEAAVVTAAAGRACDDARTQSAAADARTAFGNWINANRMNFPGWERTWSARRVPGADGWRLVQTADAPIPASFGVRDRDGQQRLVLTMALARGPGAPRTAQLVMRDVSRSRSIDISLSQRIAYGLAAGAPAPASSSVQPSARTVERLERGGSQVVFTFSDRAFRDLLALDPRESVEVRIDAGQGVQRLFFEVGDIAAARLFLTARAD